MKRQFAFLAIVSGQSDICILDLIQSSQHVG